MATGLPPPKRTLKECHEIMTAPGAPWEMEEVQVGTRKLRSYKNLLPNLRALWLQSAKVGASRDFVVFRGERHTYGQSHEKVLQIASLLHHTYGCRKGDRVAIASRNLPEWIFTFWAIQLLGCVAVAVNVWVTPDTLEHCIVFPESKVAIVDAQRAAILSKKVSRLNKSGVKDVLVLRPGSNGAPAGTKSLDDALSTLRASAAIPECDIALDDVATIFFTSGTTGLPKGVVGSNRNLLTNLPNAVAGPVRAKLRRGEDLPVPDPNAPQPASLLSVPLFHVTGCHSIMAINTLLLGKIVILNKWSTEEAVEAIIQERLTSAGGVPFMAMELVHSALGKSKHCLEVISYGGALPSKDLAASVPKNLGSATLPSQGYGATETSSLAVSVVGEDYLRRPTSTGLPSLVNDVKIVSEDGKALPPNTNGEIWIKGPNVALGYWKNPKATKEAFLPDGFYRTEIYQDFFIAERGDLGYMDDDGFVYVLDRTKDVIIRGGENIASAVVENAVFEDERILEVAAVPVPDERLGEVVGVSVFARPEYHGKIREDELIAFVGQRLPRHMVPVICHIRNVRLPRNAAGKTVKSDVKEEVRSLWLQRQKKTPQAKL